MSDIETHPLPPFYHPMQIADVGQLPATCHTLENELLLSKLPE